MTSIALHIPAGHVHPFTHERAKRAVDLAIEAEDAPGHRKRIRTEGCQPPEGFTVSAEHWERLYVPYIKVNHA